MTQSEFTHIIESLGSLSPEQLRQLRRELDGKLASTAKPIAAPPQAGDAEDTSDPILGLMRNDTQLMDEIVADVYRRRREEKWREIDL